MQKSNVSSLLISAQTGGPLYRLKIKLRGMWMRNGPNKLNPISDIDDIVLLYKYWNIINLDHYSSRWSVHYVVINELKNVCLWTVMGAFLRTSAYVWYHLSPECHTILPTFGTILRKLTSHFWQNGNKKQLFSEEYH